MASNEERIAALETDNHNMYCRLTEVQNDVRVLRDLAVSMREMTVTMNAVKEGQEDIKQRLDTIERSPAEDMRYYKRTTVACVATGLVSALITAAITLLSNTL